MIELIDAHDEIVLATHIPMDGDGLGCGIALHRALTARGKKVRFVTEAPVPSVYDFLEGREVVELIGPDEALPPFDLLLGLDAGDESRLGRAYDERPNGCRIANIDHHTTNDRYGDVAWVEGGASSTGEMVHTLLLDMNAAIDAASAQALLVSIVTDTGRFSYSNTTVGAFEAAADLVRRGADPDTIHRRLYASTPLDVLRLRARAAESIELIAGGRAALLTIESDYGADLQVEEQDLKDLVDVAIALEGVVACALVRGLPHGGTKVSLRSKSDDADVAALALRHGGGGHVRASGFSAAGEPKEVALRLGPELETLVR
ncbi:MAG: DHH family phosphoesterase [Planctomycetota bacterium]